MNTPISPQDIVQAQLAGGQSGSASAQAGASMTGGGFAPDQSADGGGAASPQLLQALHQAAAANDENAFNSLLRSAHRAQQGSARGGQAAGTPNAAPAQQMAQMNPQQRLAAALAAMQQGAPNALNAPAGPNAGAAMAGPGGMSMPNQAAGRAAPPFMPERLDRFESFLGNFIGALGEGMTVQQAAQATLRNLRAQQMLRQRLMAQAMQVQQMALAAPARQAMPAGSSPQPTMQTPQMPQSGQASPIPQQPQQVAVHRQKLQQHLQQHQAMKRALIELLVEKHSHGKR